MNARIIILITMLSIAGAMNAKGQATAYANIYVEVVAPAVVEKTADMTFRQVLTSGASGALQTATTLQSGNGTFASFTVSGSSLSTFDLSLPKETVAMSNGMMVGDFTSSNTMLASGSGNIIRIGATLNTGSSTGPGNLTAQSPFPVTLNYN